MPNHPTDYHVASSLQSLLGAPLPYGCEMYYMTGTTLRLGYLMVLGGISTLRGPANTLYTPSSLAHKGLKKTLPIIPFYQFLSISNLT